jgi:hypothetical protein
MGFRFKITGEAGICLTTTQKAIKRSAPVIAPFDSLFLFAPTMDIRRSVNTRLWADDWFETLDCDEKLLWLYLLTNQYTNMLGIYEVSISRMCFETGLSKESILKAFERFERDGKAFYLCNRFVFLVNWLKNQSMNTNMEKNASSSLKNLPYELKSELLRLHSESFESLSKALVMLPKKEKEKEDEIEIENENEKPKRKRFVPPTIDEVREVMQDENESQKFIAYYESVNWMISKKRMASWKSAIAGWKLRKAEFSKGQDQKPVATSPTKIHVDKNGKRIYGDE